MTTGETIAICVCTCKRPNMLAACLASLSEQRLPDRLSAFVIVIDNDPERSAADTVKAHTAISPLLTFYILEPIRGIANARNAALNAVNEIGADWVAFIDDDEIADPDWVADLMAPEYRDTPVLMGRHVVSPPDPRPFWSIPKRKRQRQREEGEFLKSAFTNNVRFSFDLIRAGLRFNTKLGFMGGEDGEFFSTAYVRGFHIRQTRKALTFETQHPARLTYFGQAYRSYWNSASDVRRLAVQRGWAHAIISKVLSVPLSVLAGALEVLISPVFLAAGLVPFKRRALAGGKKVAKGLGRAAAMLGIMPQPYKVIDGS